MKKAVLRRGMCVKASGTPSAPPSTPKPRKFYVRPDQTGKVLGAALGTLLRLGTGALVDGYRVSFVKEPSTEEKTYSVARVAGYRVQEETKKGTWARPEQPLEFWEFESCPFCRKAREAVTLLDLDAIYYPVTDRSGTPETFRTMAKKIADEAGLQGRPRFPMMRDPNTGKVMYESDDIIQYLYEKYGGGSTPPLMLRMGFFTALTCGLASLAQGGAGGSYKPAKKAEQNLVLWSYEGSPFCKIVRAKLNELAIPHLIKSVPRGSAKRQQLYDLTGTFQAPYLEDPNTGVKMYESAEIVDYLQKEYALANV